MNAQGRVLVPRELRQKIDIAPGDRLSARVENGALVLRSMRAVIDDVSSRYVDVPGTSVDDLLALRRADAAKE
jgi:bifunctional DNA-binding transcriptional regulator/antitoxin component of YhaV-PrlF toxin-antitoxin module